MRYTDGFAFSCLSASPSLRQAQVSLPIGKSNNLAQN